ncbi:MAG: hypothetical protein HYT07_02145 [Candidatus Levybacteria bacterium]|nr:hypothetical protein [Candidatus Levybacteria bacterium]
MPRIFLNRLLYLILLLITLFNIYLGSSLARHGEVNFFNDVARDFLLLQELDEKKIVLIGPRSSTNGLFHGPLWTYINYPAYVVGNGDPVVIAWFWIFLECIFLLTSFYMVRKMFGTLPAFVFIALISARIVPHINNVFHSEATFFFIPMLFFTIYMYITVKKNLYLVLHLLALTILIQLEVGVGIQFLILSGILIVWFIYKHKLWSHLITFSLVPLFLSNLILFDFRNDLRMAKVIFSTGGSLHFFIPLRSWVENRINNTVSLQLFEGNENKLLVLVIFGLVMLFAILQIKNKSKHKHIYLLLFFYYFGYMILSFFNKGVLLFHYVYLLIPLTTLLLVSFLGGKYKVLFLTFIVVVFYHNFTSAKSYAMSRELLIGKNYNSWGALSEVAKEVINRQNGKEFGYFVFAPDAFAYQPRYAMIYHFSKTGAKAFEYTKKPTTYVIASPPPANDPYMTHVWWRKVPLRISSEPIDTKKFPSGFTIEKFSLSQEEQRIPHDKAIELGIHFR